MLEITCRVTEEVLYAGDTVIFLLHGTQFQEIDNYIILAQCHGHIHIDHRWLKLPKKFPEIISEIPSNSSDQPSNIPNAPVIFASNKSSDNSACVLTTSKIPLATSQLFKDGVFFEFEIPHDAFPSYKGLCATISYYLTITIQQPEGTRLMHYPFTIGGVCDGKAPTYRMKYCNAVSYPVSSLPIESYYQGIEERDEITAFEINSETQNIFKIRDEDHICSIYLSGTSTYLGRGLEILFDFTQCIQQCKAVKISLIQCEKRTDGSRIQDKIISSVIRSTVDAEVLSLQLQVPEDIVCNFECPLFKVNYRLEVEFCLFYSESIDKKASTGYTEGVFENSFSFDTAISVLPANLPVHYDNKNVSNFVQARSGSRSLAHKCLESDIWCHCTYEVGN